MPNAPQPGRITPPQTTSKIPANDSVPASDVATSISVSSFASPTGEQRSRAQLQPSPTKKISAFGQAVFIIFALFIDGLEVVLDLFVIGIILNRIIDIIVAGIFLIYATIKGLTLAEDSKVYGSIAGTIVGEFIPGLDIAPFFTIDAWYITRSIKAKDRARQSMVDGQNQSIVAEQERQDWIVNYQQQQAMEAEEDMV